MMMMISVCGICQRCCDWWFSRAQEPVMTVASVDGDEEEDVDDDGDDNDSVCASGSALSSV